MNNLDMNEAPWFSIEGDTKPQPIESGSVLVVVGDAPTKYKQAEMLKEAEPDAKWMSINNGMRELVDSFPVHYHATLHACAPRYGQRFKMFFDDTTIAIGWTPNNDSHERIDVHVDGNPLCGTSALVGVLYGIYTGFERIITAGVELESVAYGSPRKLQAWYKWKPVLDGRVKAVSGRLVDILGGYNV